MHPNPTHTYTEREIDGESNIYTTYAILTTEADRLENVETDRCENIEIDRLEYIEIDRWE